MMRNQHMLKKLKSQRKEMQKATEGNYFGVYAYLRGKDSSRGKAGSPYYIGRMSKANRPWGPHRTPPPSDPARVRLLRGGLTEQGANDWERFYIRRFGRIDLGTGCLRNMTDGGEGTANPSAEHRARMSAALTGRTYSAEHRAKISASAIGKVRSAEHCSNISAALAGRVQSKESNAKRAAALIGRVHSKETNAKRAASRLHFTAAKYNVPYEQWASLSIRQRATIGQRYYVGKRGDALLEGFIDTSYPSTTLIN